MGQGWCTPPCTGPPGSPGLQGLSSCPLGSGAGSPWRSQDPTVLCSQSSVALHLPLTVAGDRAGHRRRKEPTCSSKAGAGAGRGGARVGGQGPAGRPRWGRGWAGGPGPQPTPSKGHTSCSRQQHPKPRAAQTLKPPLWAPPSWRGWSDLLRLHPQDQENRSAPRAFSTQQTGSAQGVACPSAPTSPAHPAHALRTWRWAPPGAETQSPGPRPLSDLRELCQQD